MEIILTEEQQVACKSQVLNMLLYATVAGAVGYVIWNGLVRETVFGEDAPRGYLKRLGAKILGKNAHPEDLKTMGSICLLYTSPSPRDS